MDEDGEGTRLELWRLASSAGLLLLFCFYAVYMTVHVVALICA